MNKSTQTVQTEVIRGKDQESSEVCKVRSRFLNPVGEFNSMPRSDKDIQLFLLGTFAPVVRFLRIFNIC